MKLRFSIRDLLWLTVLAAVLTAWWIDHAKQAEQIQWLERISGDPIQLPF